MFHEGDLQSGIALAVKQSKAVFCFVHGMPHTPPWTFYTDHCSDDQTNSQTWERTISQNEQACEKLWF